jgi:hypothetical protein
MRASVVPVAAVTLAFVLAAGAPAQGAEGAADAAGTYIGAAKCKLCHKKPEEGAQFDLWMKSAHAKAFATLATDKAKEDAAKKGIADPQKDPQCLKCHATAAAVLEDLASHKITLEEGVSCESCHGPGSGYYKKKTMEEISAGTLDGKTVGLIKPTEAVCKTCHTPEGNSFYKEFVFAERVKEIAHPRPKAAPAGS